MRRWIAYKMLLKDINNSQVGEDGFIEIGDKKIARVNVVGTVVSKFIAEDKKYGNLTIDDGTDTIRLRQFDNLDLIENFEIGDIIRVIGRIRKYEDEIYIVPEIIKKIDEKFEIMQKLEAIKHRAIINKPKEEEIIFEEEVISGTPKEDILNKIKELDKGNGVDIEELAKALDIDEEILSETLNDMINDGDIYTPKAGKVKILE